MGDDIRGKLEALITDSSMFHAGQQDERLRLCRLIDIRLEAQASNYPEIPDSSTPPPVATDEELRAAWNVPGTNLDAFRAVYNLDIEHGQASSREVADPAPVAGDAEELVDDLRNMASQASEACQFHDAKIILRAANMIQRQSEQEAGR
jgi:hypothetical protein